MARKLFCEISPLTYQISTRKMRLIRHSKNFFGRTLFANRHGTPLPVVIYRHKSLIRRKLGQVDMTLQEGKATNLALAAPKVNGILIHPGETFSFWRLVGICTARKGYKMGLLIARGQPDSGIGGGMCQFTNLIHWLVLHSPLVICEHHHHDGVDMFPDYGRVVPFGLGTSIVYNYLDYQFTNPTKSTFQLITHVTGTHLVGELRASEQQPHSYSVKEDESCFVRIHEDFYRQNVVSRRTIDKSTGNTIHTEIIKKSHARVMYELP